MHPPKIIGGWGANGPVGTNFDPVTHVTSKKEKVYLSVPLQGSAVRFSDLWTVTDCWQVAETLMPAVCDGSNVHYYNYLAQNAHCRQNDVNFCSVEFGVVLDDTALRSDSHLFLCVVSLSAD